MPSGAVTPANRARFVQACEQAYHFGKGKLAARLIQAGARVKPGTEDSIEVAGLDARSIGDLAAAKGLTLHELATQRASLEDAFMDLTRDSVEFRAAKAAA